MADRRFTTQTALPNCHQAVAALRNFLVEMVLCDAVSFVKGGGAVNSYLPHL
jgi:hypothetical protein